MSMQNALILNAAIPAIANKALQGMVIQLELDALMKILVSLHNFVMEMPFVPIIQMALFAVAVTVLKALEY